MRQQTRARKSCRPVPLQHRTSPEIEALVRRERIDEEFERVVYGYLGVFETLVATEIVGPLRGSTPLRHAVGFGGD